MGITNLAQFRIALSAEETFAKYVQTVVLKVSLQVLSGVVFETRVKTGRARGNWQVTTGSPSEEEDSGRVDPSGGATMAAGSSAVAHASPFGVVWIVNNLPYIEKLEALDHMADNTATRVSSQFV